LASDVRRRYPEIGEELSQEISLELTHHLNGVRVTDPQDVQRFIEQNPNWWTQMTYQEICRALYAERLLLVDVVTFRTRSPNNAQFWQGYLSADVKLAEVEATEAGSAEFTQSLAVTYPPREPIGRLDTNEQEIRRGTRRRFSHKLGRFFYDHKRLARR
jgi:hypothetical protein